MRERVKTIGPDSKTQLVEAAERLIRLSEETKSLVELKNWQAEKAKLEAEVKKATK
jgi:hypothetical protein